MGEDLLGGGLDIDGWSYLKTENGRSVADLMDRSHVHRQQMPLVRKSLLPRAMHRDLQDIVINVLELKTSIDPHWMGE